MKNKRLVTVVILFILIASSLSNGFATDFKFYYDVFNHWAVETIMWASNDVKLFKGYEDGTFRPDNEITIAEYTTLLYRVGKIHGLINDYNEKSINEEVSNNLLSYIDLSQDFWAFNEITSVANYIDKQNGELRFTDIFPGEQLQPSRSITREEAVILMSFFTTPPINSDEVSFEDIDADYKYSQLLSNLVNNKIIEGYEDNTFRPEQFITRAESATIFRRLYNDTKYLSKNYLDKVQLVNVPQYRRFMLFGDYENLTLANSDIAYRRAVATLEYKSIIHYIPYEERHLYDSDPISTLRNLKDTGYWNTIGINYYLVTQGSISDKSNTELYLDMLDDYISRDDILDDESIMIFELDYSYLDSLDKIVIALDKWYNTTSNNDSKLNSLFLRSKIYSDKEDYLKAIELYDSQEYFDLDTIDENEGNIDRVDSLDNTNGDNSEILNENENNNDNTETQENESSVNTETQVNENNDTDVNNLEENHRIVLYELEDKAKKSYFMNKAYLLLLNGQHYEAEKTLRDGWSFMSSEVHDEDFIGALKQVLLEIEKYEATVTENSTIEESINDEVKEQDSEESKSKENDNN